MLEFASDDDATEVWAAAREEAISKVAEETTGSHYSIHERNRVRGTVIIIIPVITYLVSISFI